MANRGGRRASHASLILRYGEPLSTVAVPLPRSWIALLAGAAAAQGIARRDLILSPATRARNKTRAAPRTSARKGRG